MKHNKIASLLLGLVFVCSTFTGCLKEGTDTIVLPLPDGKIPISIIPQDLQDSLVINGFDINEGCEPPLVNGSYLSSPMVLHYASDQYINNFYDLQVNFMDQQPRGLLTYSELQDNTVTGNSIGANIIGSNDAFTMYCYQNVADSLNGEQLWRCKTATVISGNMNDSGIVNCKYALIILEKEAINEYYSSQIPDSNTFRIFFDGDSLAVKL